MKYKVVIAVVSLSVLALILAPGFGISKEDADILASDQCKELGGNVIGDVSLANDGIMYYCVNPDRVDPELLQEYNKLSNPQDRERIGVNFLEPGFICKEAFISGYRCQFE